MLESIEKEKGAVAAHLGALAHSSCVASAAVPAPDDVGSFLK